jgi:hypothetical protein
LVISNKVTSDEPSAIAGSRLICVVMPKRRKGLAHAHRADELAIVVLRAPVTDAHRLVFVDILGRYAAFQRGGINEELERRTGLASRHDRPIIVGAHIIGATHHRFHAAIARQRH